MLLTVQACMPGAGQEKVTAMPAWVASPSQDTTEYIYGIGSGDSYNAGKESALKEITGKLITEISSKSKSEVSQHNAHVSRSANLEITTRTIETQLSNYEVLKSEQVGREIFVQISMSRPGFIKNTSSRLKEIDNKIKSTMRDASHKTKLQQLIVLQDLEPFINKARSLVLLLQAAGGKQNADERLTYYGDLLSKMDSLTHKVIFNVRASKNLRGFAEHLTALLHSEKISASNTNKKKADAFININGKVNSSVMFSQYIAQIKMTIKISDAKGHVISEKEYESSGSSVSNKNSAVEAAEKSLGNKFKDNGVLASLGLIEKK